ncbi:MAG: glycosyltransferase [Methanomassiliicoccus sp.]|nr:glycosyltransferase [Methanomassiliicoccus sp.]
MAISSEGTAIQYENDLPGPLSDTDALLIERRRIAESNSDFISFVIPAYNEGGKIYKNLLECLRVVRRYGVPFELVVVNDGSSDNTIHEIIRAAAHSPEIVPVSYSKNVGKGNALKVGARRASGNLVVFMDADLEIHPKHAMKFMYMLKATEADVVIGSKRHPDSKVDYPTKRKFLSWGYHLLIKAMFNLDVTDTQPGFKLFRKDVLDKEINKVEAQRYAFDLDLLVNVQADGYKIVEAPIELNFSRSCGGRIGFKTVKSIFKETMGVFYRARMAKSTDNTNVAATSGPQD